MNEESIKLIESAAKELRTLISDHNKRLRDSITPVDLDEPDYLDLQTVYELMLLADDLREQKL